MPGFDAAARDRLTRGLKDEARRLGFDGCGVSEATMLDDEARRLDAWLRRGMNASMAWMENHFDKRIDPRQLVDGARSVVSVIHNHYQPQSGRVPGAARIAQYAWGDDYHDVMRARLGELFAWLDDRVGPVGGRAFVDSAPVLDRAWAVRGGLGWQGKNANVLTRAHGSFVFLGELIVDVPLTPDGPVPDHCGTCTRCLDACPTGAIPQPYVVDANRCISYLTIEHRGDWPADAPVGEMGDWIFGCDICQDVCPWNSFAHVTEEPRYAAREGVAEASAREWLEVPIDAWRRRFKGSAVKRAKFEGWLRNATRAAAHAATSPPDPPLPSARARTARPTTIIRPEPPEARR